MIAVALVIERVEFYLADAAREFSRGREGTGRERGNNGHVHDIDVAIL